VGVGVWVTVGVGGVPVLVRVKVLVAVAVFVAVAVAVAVFVGVRVLVEVGVFVAVNVMVGVAVGPSIPSRAARARSSWMRGFVTVPPLRLSVIKTPVEVSAVRIWSTVAPETARHQGETPGVGEAIEVLGAQSRRWGRTK
jgi:hypothetical protein